MLQQLVSSLYMAVEPLPPVPLAKSSCLQVSRTLGASRGWVVHPSHTFNKQDRSSPLSCWNSQALAIRLSLNRWELKRSLDFLLLAKIFVSLTLHND